MYRCYGGTDTVARCVWALTVCIPGAGESRSNEQIPRKQVSKLTNMTASLTGCTHSQPNYSSTAVRRCIISSKITHPPRRRIFRSCFVSITGRLQAPSDASIERSWQDLTKATISLYAPPVFWRMSSHDVRLRGLGVSSCELYDGSSVHVILLCRTTSSQEE